MNTERIGFIGLGRMGRPMAAHLAANTTRLRAWDVRTACAAGLRADRIEWAASIRELAETSSLIFIMVFDDDQVRQVVLGPQGVLAHAAPDTLVVDMTSSDPEVTRELDRALREKDISMVDAPVTGGVEAAVKASLYFLIGGESEHVERVRPLLEVMGKKCLHIGPIGSGHAMKLMNNFISALTMAATTEVVALAQKAGIPADRVVEALQNGTGTSDAATRKFPNHVFPDREIGFPIDLMHKDVKTYLRFAGKNGIPTLLSSITCQLWHLNVVEGRGPKDAVHFVELYEQWCKVPILGLAEL